MRTTGLRLAAIGVALATVPAWAGVQTAPQQGCINALNAAGAKLAAAAGKNFRQCLATAAHGRLPAGQSAEQCLAADDHGVLAKARAIVAGAAQSACGVAPDFGPKTAADVDAFAPVLRVHDVFGPSLDAAVIPSRTNGPGAGCQRVVAQGLVKIAQAKLGEWNRCVKDGLDAGTIASAVDLQGCVDVDPRGKVAKKVASAQATAARKCATTAITTALPGRCANEPLATLLACVEPQVQCSVCIALDAESGAGAGCHHFVAGVASPYCGDRPATTWSVARQWDEELLSAIRIDLPRPPVHARNLFHVSAAMWDAWAAYDPTADAVVDRESPASSDPEGDRAVAISFAAYRTLSHLYALSVNAGTTQASLDARMNALGLDKTYTSTAGGAPAAVGNRIAAAVIAYGLADGSNEAGNYADPGYAPVNDPMIVKLAGTTMNDPNRWQPLALDFQVTQNNIPIPDKIQKFVGARWNGVTPFALTRSDPNDVYLDPGPPPHLGGAGDAEYKAGTVQVILFSSQLDPADGAMLDISPASWGNNPLGTNDGHGYAVNPATGQPYAPQPVKRADFTRVLAEFWADGPDSETPPGHWNVLANYVSDQPSTVKRIGGTGPVVNDLEWDVKTYLALNGAVHDAAVECWGVKRKYDSVRPISQVRYMAGLGQSSDASGPSYDPNGLPLVPGLIEVITAASSAAGQRHEALAAYVGEIAIYAWPGEPADPTTQVSGARWIRATTWVPYQRNTFVTPPFASYFSGHSTFSRSAAEVLTRLTGSAYFPGGLGEYVAPANTFLKFELGPTTDVRLQWATYYDAADQAGLSRLYGGIHPRVDDFTGRLIGSQVGIGAWNQATRYFDGTAVP